jgi:hypothetical protein
MFIRPSSRTAGFHDAIRNIVGAAEALERSARRVNHLNITITQWTKDERY